MIANGTIRSPGNGAWYGAIYGSATRAQPARAPVVDCSGNADGPWRRLRRRQRLDQLGSSGTLAGRAEPHLRPDGVPAAAGLRHRRHRPEHVARDHRRADPAVSSGARHAADRTTRAQEEAQERPRRGRARSRPQPHRGRRGQRQRLTSPSRAAPSPSSARASCATVRSPTRRRWREALQDASSPRTSCPRASASASPTSASSCARSTCRRSRTRRRSTPPSSAAAPDHIPMPMDEAILDFQSLGLVQTPSGPRTRVVIVAARREMIDRLVGAAKAPASGRGHRPLRLRHGPRARPRARGRRPLRQRRRASPTSPSPTRAAASSRAPPPAA